MSETAFVIPAKAVSQSSRTEERAARASRKPWARGLPPVASTLSVMMISVLGVFSGAVWLNEAVHWQDRAAGY